MKKQTKRQEKLIQIIEKQGLLPAKNLASILQVSEMTIRRDLQALQFKPAAENIQANSEYSLLHALKKSNDQKNRIGKFAASLIDNNDVIALDTGSTTARMLPHISKEQNLTILCYNANVLLELKDNPGINLIFCGGIYHKETEMFECPESIQFIQRTRANKVFLSAAGIHRKLGITCINSYEVATKQAIIQSSLERILVADSGKFSQISPAYFCDISDIDTIVTDNNLETKWQNLIISKGIKLYLV